jgi:hypothetical protein
MSHKSKSLSKLLTQIDDEYKRSFLPVVLPQNRLDALLAVTITRQLAIHRWREQCARYK